MKLTANSIRVLAVCLAVLLAVSLGGCNLFGSKDDGKETSSETAETGDEYPAAAGGAELAVRPERIVSLAPAMTEKLCDLGAETRLVGISDYCDYPTSIAGLRACGTAQMPDLDAICSLAPQLVVTEAALPEEAISALEEAGIAVATFPHAASVNALMDTYRDLGILLEGTISGAALGSSTGDRLFDALGELYARLDEYTAKNGKQKVLYLRLLDSTVATGDTFEGELLRAMCMENLAEDYTNWVLPEAARTAGGISELASADMIFLDESSVTMETLSESAVYGELPAVVHGRCRTVSGIVFERQSLRMMDALRQMAGEAYPEAMGLEADEGTSAGDAKDSQSTAADSATEGNGEESTVSE